MKIAIMTSSFRERREGGPEIPYPESIARCKAAGFDVLDLNLCSMKFPERNVFCRDDWEKYLEEVLKAKEEHKVEFYQSHPPYLGGRILAFEDEKENEFFWEMTRRSLEITARVGASWAVLHPVCGEPTDSFEEHIRLNHQVFGESVELAERLGIGVAFENMSQIPGTPWRFGCTAEELVALADSFHSPAVGICWDFGHANLSRLDQPKELRLIGERLKTVHVADNLGVKDDHFIPFEGLVPWEEIMPILTEIGFSGHLVLEVRLTSNMPDRLKDAGARLAAEADRLLLSMA
ncbi:MAG: sugar phosphate isomerase/epimerase [Lachnospiraceae bacterium]|nr:sugar phosphate isomerase/epimerase [Lachnospiraceae bacterium]